MNTPYFKPANTLKRIAQAVSTTVPQKPAKRKAQAEGEMDGQTVVQSWLDEWVGTTGHPKDVVQLRSLTALIEAIGFADINEFLDANPEAQEKLVEFIGRYVDNNPSLKATLESDFETDEEDGPECTHDEDSVDPDVLNH